MVGGVECREAWLVHLEANVSRETFAFGGASVRISLLSIGLAGAIWWLRKTLRDKRHCFT